MTADREWRFSSAMIAILVPILIVLGLLCSFAVAAENNTTTDEMSDASIIWWMGLTMVIIGAILLVVELSSPGFFIAIPGSILIVLGIVALSAPNLFTVRYSVIIAIVTAALASAAVIFFYRKLGEPEPPTTTVGSSLIGRVGRITVATDPDRPTKGKVRIGSEVWSASADEPLPPGTKVEITRSEGVHVHVERIDGFQ